MNAAFRSTLLFLVLFITGQTWGLSVTHHQYDAGNVDHDTNEYVYDADVSLQFCRGNQSQGKNAKDGYLLAFIGDFLAPKKGGDFFKGTKYTDKVKKQIQQGDFHSFPESVKGFQGAGKVSKLKGGDGVVRDKLEIPGGYRGREGKFEFIKEPNGNINHRLFKPNRE